MAIKVDAKSLKKVLTEISGFGKDARDMLGAITENNARLIESGAIRNVSVDNGTIKQSIHAYPENKLNWTIGVNAVPIAAYVEFGTGVRVKVPNEWKDLAWQFYVNGQGYMPPQPYLYPAYVYGRDKYEKDVNKLIDRLTKKFNNG